MFSFSSSHIVEVYYHSQNWWRHNQIKEIPFLLILNLDTKLTDCIKIKAVTSFFLIFCCWLSLANDLTMKKIFTNTKSLSISSSSSQPNEMINTANYTIGQNYSHFIGKTFQLSKHTVCVDDVIAEGGIFFFLMF